MALARDECELILFNSNQHEESQGIGPGEGRHQRTQDEAAAEYITEELGERLLDQLKEKQEEYIFSRTWSLWLRMGWQIQKW